MLGLRPEHIILIIVVAVLIFGPSQLPILGKSIGEFFKEMRNVKSELKKAVDETKED